MARHVSFFSVIPASPLSFPTRLGIQCTAGGRIPAYAGMTASGAGENLLPTSISSPLGLKQN